MGGLKTKLVLFVMFYMMGFATAVYTLTPASTIDTDHITIQNTSAQEGFGSQWIDKQKVKQVIYTSIDQCLAFGKHLAGQTGHLIREYIEQKQNPQNTNTTS